MALNYHKDRLQALFPHWYLGHREIIWLWLYLQARGATSNLGNFGAGAMRDGMADLISQWGLAAEIDNQQSYMLLPEQVFNWIERNGRQPAWLLREVQRTFQGLPVYPVDLTPRERLIASLDSWNIEKSGKLSAVDRLKGAWVHQQVLDRKLSWYASAGNEKQKCQIAWHWYQDHHSYWAIHATEFARMEDIFEFLDSTTFRQDEKLHHLEQIKKKFKARQTEANRQGKKQTNISLSEDARRQLDDLARQQRRTKTEIIELLIRNAHEHDIPH